jgi:hypothetical protein
LFFPGFLLAPREDTAWAELEPLVAACERDAFEQADVSLEHGPLRVLAPATLGFPWRVLAGVERTLLVDYDVQVAPQSWMPSPQVEHVLDGVLAQGYLAGAGLACDAWVASSREPRDLERKDIGVGRMQTLQRTASVGDGIVRRGAPRLALVPASANAPALSVQMRP